MCSTTGAASHLDGKRIVGVTESVGSLTDAWSDRRWLEVINRGGWEVGGVVCWVREVGLVGGWEVGRIGWVEGRVGVLVGGSVSVEAGGSGTSGTGAVVVGVLGLGGVVRSSVLSLGRVVGGGVLGLGGVVRGSVLGLGGNVGSSVLSLSRVVRRGVLGLGGDIGSGVLGLGGVFRCSILSLDRDIVGGSLGRSGDVAHHLLSLGGIVGDGSLGDLSGMAGVVSSDLLDLNSLLVGDAGSVAHVVVDEVLVGAVDQWSQEEGGSTNQREAPEWNDLDEVVGDERGKENLKETVSKNLEATRGRTYGNRGEDVLSKDDTLRLNDKEVDELMDIADESVECLLGESVVLSRTNLRGKSGAKGTPASNLGDSSHTERHPRSLEGVTQDVKVASGEDEDDGCDVGDARRTWVLPAQKAREEGVVVGEVLTGGGLGGWGGTSGSQVGELVGGLGGLVLDALSDWAIGQRVVLDSVQGRLRI